MYGLRDAGAAFDRKVLDVMNLMGVSLGKFSICVGNRKVMDTLVRLVRRGGDFSMKWTEVQEAIHLNALLRLYPPGAEGGERWELEADPRHVEILVSQMGLSNESKGPEL